MKRFLRWLNRKLNIVETDPEANAYYAWADARLDALEAERRVAQRAREHTYTPRYPQYGNSICTCGLARTYCERRDA